MMSQFKPGIWESSSTLWAFVHVYHGSLRIPLGSWPKRQVIDVPVVKQIAVPQIQTIEKIVEIPFVQALETWYGWNMLEPRSIIES